jgi:hypothetical protein
MKFTSNKKNEKIELGKKTAEGYVYMAKVDFSQDISTQISKVIKEKEINEILKNKIQELKKTIDKFSNKEKNLQYYYKIGAKLLFLDDKPFKEVAIGSVVRRIFEELPEILPNIQNKDMAGRHLNFMYWIAHIGQNTLSKASWDQWFEITKFREIYKKPKLLNLILQECEFGLRGHESLNKKIKDLLKKE